MVTGFVHKPYPPIYARLATAGGFASSILVRGVEGGIVPSLSQAARYFTSEDGETLLQVDIEPKALGIDREERAVPLPAHLIGDSVRSVKAPQNPFAGELATHAAQLGLATLEGKQGYTRDSLVYSGAVILYARGKANTLQAGANQVRTVLDNDSARHHLLTS